MPYIEGAMEHIQRIYDFNQKIDEMRMKSLGIQSIDDYYEFMTPDCYQWIDRESFHRIKVGDDWRAGLIRVVWSFGNNGKDYIFSQENERIKKPLHLLIVE